MSPFVKDVLLALVIGICATLLGLMGVRYFILPGLLVVDAFTPLNIRTATDVPLSAIIVNLLFWSTFVLAVRIPHWRPRGT